jgi:hypothetical protein
MYVGIFETKLDYRKKLVQIQGRINRIFAFFIFFFPFPFHSSVLSTFRKHFLPFCYLLRIIISILPAPAVTEE